MAKELCLDGRLVYLHCSAIFVGANAQVRKVKKIMQLLQSHKASIKILTKEYSLSEIAVVAKELLEKRIFESLPRAKLLYPELFQPSSTQEAERAASEAETVRIETRMAQDAVLKSDDEDGDDCLDQNQSLEKNKSQLQDKKEPHDDVEALENAEIHVNSVKSNRLELHRHLLDSHTSHNSELQKHPSPSLPKLHPVYLPFKTQHQIMIAVQTLLEECCLEFGNAWVPDLMKAQNWNEAESIELTEWTKRFSKKLKYSPQAAFRLNTDEDIQHVLFAVSPLRHSAVHRLPTSAAGILNMLAAAIAFAKALDNSEREKRIAEIKARLEDGIEEIVEHQNLLERKLEDQLRDIARRRAEIDELEKSSIEEILKMDRNQRTEVGRAFESFLAGCNQETRLCAGCQTTHSNQASPGLEARKNIEDEAEVREHDLSDMDKTQQDEYVEEVEGFAFQDDGDKGFLEDPGISERDGAKHQDQILTPADEDIFADEAPISEHESAPVFDIHIANSKDPADGEWTVCLCNEVNKEPHNVKEKAINAKNEFFTSPGKVADIVDFHVDKGGHLPGPGRGLLPNKNASEEGRKGSDNSAPKAPRETFQTSFDIQVLEGAHDNFINDCNEILPDSKMNHEPAPEPEVANVENLPALDTSHTQSHVQPSDGSFRYKPPLRLCPSPVLKATQTPVAIANASNAPAEEGNTVMLNVVIGSEVHRCVVSINECTQTALLEAADAQTGINYKLLSGDQWSFALTSWKMEGFEVDLSTYEAEDLSSLIKAGEKTGIPTFTVQLVRNSKGGS